MWMHDMPTILADLIKQSTVRIQSHGAFGESESYERVDIDHLAKLIVTDIANTCMDRAFDEHDKGTKPSAQRQKAILAIRTAILKRYEV